MGLFRIAIVVGAVVALMPSDRNSQAQLYERAAAAAKWPVTFCDRNGELCRQGGEMWGVFVKKAQFAGEMAVQLIQEQATRRGDGELARARHESGLPVEPAADRRVPPLERRQMPVAEHRDVPALERRERGTLSDGDLRPEWRGRDARDFRRGY